MKVKVNNIDNVESVEVYLSREKTPIAFDNKLQELMECGAFEEEEEAIRWIENTPFVMELYYEKDQGLFLVESERLENSGYVCSPYTQEEMDYGEEEV